MAYITVEDLRKEGFANPPYTTEKLESVIDLAQQLIDYITNRFFEEVEDHEIILDGSGLNTIRLPIPPVTTTSITLVELNDVEKVIDDDYEVLMPSRQPDGRFNPKLALKNGELWTKGTRNVKVVGSFGFVDRIDVQGTPTSFAPKIIQDCMKRIVALYLPCISDPATRNANRIIEESLKDYEYTLSEIKTTGYFDDVFIDRALSVYKKINVFTV